MLSKITKTFIFILATALLLVGGCGDSTNSGDENVDPEPIPPRTDIPTAANDGLTVVDLTDIDASDFVSAGTGTHSRAEEEITVEVPAGATVERVFIYWAQRGEEQYGLPDESTITVGGTEITGNVSGGPVDAPGNIPAGVTYKADISDEELINPGSNTFTIQDNPPEQVNPLGASVLVFYSLDGVKSQLQLFDGVDFAWGPAKATDPNRQEALRSSVPVTFRFDTAAVEREANITLFIGDINPDEKEERPNSMRYEVGADGETQQIGPYPNPFQGRQGRDWDNYTQTITIPNGVGELTVFPVSGPGDRPTSLVWSLAGFSITPPEDE